MGTTDPTSAIFLTDTPKEIEEKVNLFVYIKIGKKTCSLWWWYDKKRTLRKRS